MNIFGIGLPEMALIMVLALLVFGPKKLPEIGRSMGKALKGFQDASKEFEEEFKREAKNIEQTVSGPMKASLEDSPPKALSPQPAEVDINQDQAAEPQTAEVVEDSSEPSETAQQA